MHLHLNFLIPVGLQPLGYIFQFDELGEFNPRHAKMNLSIFSIQLEFPFSLKKELQHFQLYK